MDISYNNPFVSHAKTFKVLGHPDRIRIMVLMAGMRAESLNKTGGTVPSQALSRLLEITPNMMAVHLKEMEYAGLIMKEYVNGYLYVRINNTKVAELVQGMTSFLR